MYNKTIFFLLSLKINLWLLKFLLNFKMYLYETHSMSDMTYVMVDIKRFICVLPKIC